MQAFVIGNVAIDETVAIADWPQPGASILGAQTARDLGGKGCNQAVIMARCGLPTRLVAAIGDDYRAAMIRDALAAQPLATELIELTGRISDYSMILTTPDGENRVITTNDCASHLDAATAGAALKTAAPGDLLVMQGNLGHKASIDLLRAARDRGMVSALNPSPLRPWFGDLWPLVDIAFVNQGEAQALTGADGAEAAQALMARGPRCVVVTLGAGGAMLARCDRADHVPGQPGHVVDTTGAGDCFMAVALASAALRGQAMPDLRALRDASRAAAITISRPGTCSAFPGGQELQAILTAD